MQGQVFLKWGGDWHFSLLTFLHLEITLPFAKLRHAFEEKIFFPATIIYEKMHSKVSKDETENIPEIKVT